MKTTFPRLPEELRTTLQAPADPTGANALYSLVTWPQGRAPRASIAQIGPAEVSVLADDLLALVLWPGSGSATNLASSGKGHLLLQVDQAFVTVELQVVLTHDDLARRGSGFVARVVEVLWDEVDYARITSRPTFVLTDPDATAERWRANEQTINDMRSKLWQQRASSSNGPTRVSS
jgi:hypothetical protein